MTIDTHLTRAKSYDARYFAPNCRTDNGRDEAESGAGERAAGGRGEEADGVREAAGGG